MPMDGEIIAAQDNWWSIGAAEQMFSSNMVLIAVGILGAWVLYMTIIHYGNKQLKQWDHKQMTDERRDILQRNVNETDAGSVVRVLNAVVETTEKPVKKRKAQMDIEWMKKEYDVT